MSASAVTPNTIREKFGLQLAPDVALLKNELLRVQSTIRAAQEVELYNRVLADASTEALDEKIAELTVRADGLYKSVKGGIDTPLEQLMLEEAEYGSTVTALNQLLGARDLQVPTQLETPDEDLRALMKRESRLSAEIKYGGSYTDIGRLDYYPVKGVPYRVNSPFGSRYDPVGVRGYQFHYGVDLKAPSRTPIGAWFSGTVLSTGRSTGSGLYVWIDHGNGVRTYYCHLDRIDVKKGQRVGQGDQIALSGNTGTYTTGPHLHLGLYIDGTAVDPRVILG